MKEGLPRDSSGQKEESGKSNGRGAQKTPLLGVLLSPG